jgi:hypothetical protein
LPRTRRRLIRPDQVALNGLLRDTYAARPSRQITLNGPLRPPELLQEPAHPHGESVKTVQARLVHASAAETLDTYSHLWPDSDDRTRAAVDSVLGQVADPVRTDAAL